MRLICGLDMSDFLLPSFWGGGVDGCHENQHRQSLQIPYVYESHTRIAMETKEFAYRSSATLSLLSVVFGIYVVHVWTEFD